ncbi:hypothetical protein [Paraflavitalea speifideaquila]|uniref:hypothetical protein n=1 Tax=Paraflavitalea speifideaquila TaxID=3076558 RepID=UPI0028E97400|nr:hypothetical protein [Paraflavitalea speifideiaquila]
MKFNIINKALLVAGICLLFASCIKDEVTDTTNHGSTFVKVMESPENQLFLTPFSTIKK